MKEINGHLYRIGEAEKLIGYSLLKYYIMKKQEFKSNFTLNKSVISNFETSQVKGRTIGIESVDRLNCETEDCVTQDCITILQTNYYQCPKTTC